MSLPLSGCELPVLASDSPLPDCPIFCWESQDENFEEGSVIRKVALGHHAEWGRLLRIPAQAGRD